MSSGSFNLVIPRRILKLFGKNRANCSPFHLLAATYACDIARDIEKRYADLEPTDADRKLYVAMSSTTIMCSVAALESRINEYIIDNRKQIDNFPKITNPKIIAKYKLKSDIPLSEQLLKQTNLLCKYDIICLIKKGTIPDETKLTENIRYLTDLRNAMTHFTPEWDNEPGKHAELKKSKKNRFTLSAFYAADDLLFMPEQCMCASCAQWATKSASEFLQHFNSVET